jgi:hypothetical protein
VSATRALTYASPPFRGGPRREQLVNETTVEEVTYMPAWVWVLLLVLLVIALFGGVGFYRR